MTGKHFSSVPLFILAIKKSPPNGVTTSTVLVLWAEGMITARKNMFQCWLWTCPFKLCGSIAFINRRAIRWERLPVFDWVFQGNRLEKTDQYGWERERDVVTDWMRGAEQVQANASRETGVYDGDMGIMRCHTQKECHWDSARSCLGIGGRLKWRERGCQLSLTRGWLAGRRPDWLAAWLGRLCWIWVICLPDSTGARAGLYSRDDG